MALWDWFRATQSPDAKTVCMLQQMSNQNTTVEVRQFNAKGEMVASGKSRVQEYLQDVEQLVIDLPTREGRPLAIGAGDRAAVSFGLDGYFYAFETKVFERRVYHPEDRASFIALLLTVPQQFESGNRRQFYRLEPRPQNLPVVHWRPLSAKRDSKAGLRWFEVEVHDISSGGLSLRMPTLVYEKFVIGMLLELSILLPGAQEPLRLLGRVCNLRYGTEDRDNRVGLKFELPEKQADLGVEAITRYIARCEREMARDRIKD